MNVFGAVAMMKAVLPFMRERRRGHILNITSMGGYITMPGIAYYCGSKFALEGISEALGKEVKPFGIAVTAVAPGSFRTDWAGRSMSANAPLDRRLRRYLRSDPQGARGEERQAIGRSRKGGARDARRDRMRIIRPRIFCSAAMHSGSCEASCRRGSEIRAWEPVTVSTDG